jgi:hypothetical protein
LKPRTAVLAGLAGTALAVPASASAATLRVDRPCYRAGEAVRFSGAGYTPSGSVALSVSGQQLGLAEVDPLGGFDASLEAPEIDGRRRTDTFTATDQTNLSLTASAPVLLTSVNVDVEPRNGNPGEPKRIVARGFTSGNVLYAHVRRGNTGRNVRIGRLRGPCGTLRIRRRLFSLDARTGVYTVQFDARRRYSARTEPQVGFVVTVGPT